MSDGPNDERIEITRDGGVVAVADVAWGADGLVAAITPARSFGLLRTDALAVIDVVVAAARARNAVGIDLAAKDPLVRSAARATGFDGPLRANLAFDLRLVPAVPAATRLNEPPDVVAELEAFLPDTRVVVDRGGWAARISRRMVTGMAGNARITAERDGAHATTVAAIGRELMTESLAAALDTLLTLAARFPTIARRFPTVVFAMADLQMVEGHVSGEAGSGGISINPAHVNIAAMETLALRGSPAIPAFGLGARVPRRSLTSFLPVDGVVAHEVGHCIDHLVRGGRLSDTTDFRQRIGRALGVESVELALRGRSPDAPPEWQHAHRDLVDQISGYATTNGVELFAEIFEGWFHGGAGSVIAAFGPLMDERFPR